MLQVCVTVWDVVTCLGDGMEGVSCLRGRTFKAGEAGD